MDNILFICLGFLCGIICFCVLPFYNYDRAGWRAFFVKIYRAFFIIEIYEIYTISSWWLGVIVFIAFLFPWVFMVFLGGRWMAQRVARSLIARIQSRVQFWRYSTTVDLIVLSPKFGNTIQNSGIFVGVWRQNKKRFYRIRMPLFWQESFYINLDKKTLIEKPSAHSMLLLIENFSKKHSLLKRIWLNV